QALNDPCALGPAGRRELMFTHGPNCLEGPLSRTLGWWNGSVQEDGDQTQPLEMPQGATITQDLPRHPTPLDPDVRADLVERIRREIAEGAYDTQERWEAALDKLLKCLHEK